MTRILDIVTVVSNPIRWETRVALAERAVKSWLQEPNVRITLVEAANGGRSHSLSHLSSDRVAHIPVRTTTMAWNKESLLNHGISRLSSDVRYVATLDADVTWRKQGWARETIKALDLYPVIQPWSAAYDLGPNDEPLATFKSFASMYHAGNPVVPRFDKNNVLTNSPYDYPHPGYAWAWCLDILNKIGGLFDLGGVGSGDHHMALALIGKANMSIPRGVNKNYEHAIMTWQDRAQAHVNRKLGFIHSTIEHPFHGRKVNRNYNGRWDMFLRHSFDPYTDLKRNIHGILEFAGNKPSLEREWDRYMRAREEDANTLN